jgi:hypothetical protein
MQRGMAPARATQNPPEPGSSIYTLPAYPADVDTSINGRPRRDPYPQGLWYYR